MSKLKCIPLIKICFIGVFVFLLIKNVSIDTLWAAFGWPIFWATIIVQPIMLCCLASMAMRHMLVIGPPIIRYGVAFRAIVLSQGLNLILPARLSELLKATYLRDHANVPFSRGISAVVMERSVDVLIVAALGMFGMLEYFDRGNFLMVVLLGFVFGLTIPMLVRSPKFVLRIVNIMPSKRLAEFLERTYLYFCATACLRVFWYTLLLGLVAWGLSYLSVLIFLEMAGSIEIGFSGALLVFVLTTLGGAIPALPGGLGTYEAAAVVALRSLGYEFDEALLLALFLHVSQLVLPFGMAVLIMLTERIGVSSVVKELRNGGAS